MPRRSRSMSRSGTPASGMFTLKRAVPVAKSTAEGTAMPTASALPAARIAVTNCSRSSSSFSESVGQLPTSSSAVPWRAATATLVPPTSTPMRRSATPNSYPIAHEQHVLMLDDVHQLQCDRRVKRGPRHRHLALAAGQDGSQAQEQLVHEAGPQQRPEQHRAALAEQAAHAVLLAQAPEGLGLVGVGEHLDVLGQVARA